MYCTNQKIKYCINRVDLNNKILYYINNKKLYRRFE
nr:MAG TPA: hypothetical protein [Caudoviricetes sp.]